MKQNSIFSYVKRNNNNSEGVDSNEQCSSNVKEARTGRWRQYYQRRVDLEGYCLYLQRSDAFRKQLFVPPAWGLH